MIRSMGVNFVIGFLCLMSFPLIRAQGYYVSLEEPDFNVWDADEENQGPDPQEIFSIICEKYHLTLGDEKIDCSDIRFNARELLLDDTNHVIRKREADDTVLEEGSGNGDVEQPEASLYKETFVNVGTAEPALENPVDNGNATNNPHRTEESDKGVVNADDSENKEEPNRKIEDDIIIAVQKEVQPEKKVDQSAAAEKLPIGNDYLIVAGKANIPFQSVVENKELNIEAPEETDNPQTGSEDEAAIAQVFDTEANKTEKEDAEAHSIPRSETTILPPSQSSQETSSVSPEIQEKADAAVDSESDKDGLRTATQKVLPIGQAEMISTQSSKEPEVVDVEQSANAVMFKEPKVAVAVAVEGSDSDKHLASIATNANSQASDSERPNTGESAKTVSKAGKDTTILVVLFVVVIVIGAAAFTHNFIKKRRQRSADSELVNGIRRSLQNLTSGNGKNPADIEQGTEMKPLMKTNSPVMVKAFSDKKKDAEA